MKEKVYKKGTVIKYTIGSSQYIGCDIRDEMTLDKDMTQGELDAELYQMAIEHLEPESYFEVLND